jgi:hypothetical protein
MAKPNAAKSGTFKMGGEIPVHRLGFGAMRVTGAGINESGYSLGDVFQGTAWGSYLFANWISASVRGLYTEQGEVEGHFNAGHNHSSPPDLQFNYGGRFWDIGFGINTVVPSGALRGLRLSAEWLQPVYDDPNGYQLEREGTLWANVSLAW